jgi:hypothetical protein
MKTLNSYYQVEDDEKKKAMDRSFLVLKFLLKENYLIYIQWQNYQKNRTRYIPT